MAHRLSPRTWTNLIIAAILLICLFGAVFSISIIVRKKPHEHKSAKVSPISTAKPVVAQPETNKNDGVDTHNKNNAGLEHKPNSEETKDEKKKEECGGRCPFGFDRPAKPVKRIRFDVDENDKPIPRDNKPFLAPKKISSN